MSWFLLWFDRKALAMLQKCTTKDGLPDLKKATLLLEVYAIEIQMYSAQKNFKKLKELYDKSLSIKSAIPHPRIMGTVRECGGKMHMREKAWQAAHTDFFEAFKSYDDAGSPRRYAIVLTVSQYPQELTGQDFCCWQTDTHHERALHPNCLYQVCGNCVARTLYPFYMGCCIITAMGMLCTQISQR